MQKIESPTLRAAIERIIANRRSPEQFYRAKRRLRRDSIIFGLIVLLAFIMGEIVESVESELALMLAGLTLMGSFLVLMAQLGIIFMSVQERDLDRLEARLKAGEFG